MSADKPIKRFNVAVLAIAPNEFELDLAGERVNRDSLGNGISADAGKISTGRVTRLRPIVNLEGLSNRAKRRPTRPRLLRGWRFSKRSFAHDAATSG
jgi:hypothetical protein